MNRLETFRDMSTANLLLDEYISACLLPKPYYQQVCLPESILINQFTLASLIILATNEYIIEKKETYKDNLLFSIMSEAADVIAIKQPDNTYKIDNVIFQDPADLVYKIRNKIAHGAYTLDLKNESVILDFDDGDQASIPVEKITFLARYLLLKKNEYRKVDDYDRTVAIFLTPKTTPINKKIKSLKDFNDFLDSFYVVSFNITTSEEFIPKEAYKSFELLKKQIEYYLSSRTISTKTDRYKILKECINPLVDKFNKCHNNTKIDVLIRKTNDDEKTKLIDIIKNTIQYENMEVRFLATIVGKLVIRTLDDSFNNKIPIGCITDLLDILESMGKTKTTNITTILQDVLQNRNTIDFNQDLLCTVLINRFLTVSYAFENFDMALADFDLSKLNVLKNEVEDKQMKIATIACESDKHKIISCKKSIMSIHKQIKGMKKSNNCKNKKEKLSMQRKRLINLLKSLANLYKLSIIHKKDMKHLLIDRKLNEEYYYNGVIIESIRNAISHGNIKIIPTNNLETTIIELSDIHEGKEYMRISCTYKDLKETINNINDTLMYKQDKIRTR